MSWWLLYDCLFADFYLYDLVAWVDLFPYIFLSKLICAEPQMPPRREPTEMEQLIEAQAQLMQVMAQFMANNNGNYVNNNPPP
jgi:hypothetical protein